MADDEMISPRDYFDSAKSSFDQAAARCRKFDRHYQIGDFVLGLSFAGPALIDRICPGIEHLRLELPDEAPSDFRVLLWDGASTGIAMPSPPSEQKLFPAKGEIRELIDDRIFGSFQLGSDALSLLDRDSLTGIFCVRDAAQVPPYEAGSPLRYLLHLFLQSKDWQYLHGAAVGFPEACVLITGRGGMGKSTTALSCLSSKLGYLGDDYVLLSSNELPTIHSLYNSAKITANSEKYFPELLKLVAKPRKRPEEKSILFLFPELSERLLRSSPLKAILIPRIGPNSEPRLEAVSAIEGLKAMAPSTMVQLPGANAVILQRLSATARKVPTFILHLSPNPKETPFLLEEFLLNDRRRNQA